MSTVIKSPAGHVPPGVRLVSSPSRFFSSLLLLCPSEYGWPDPFLRRGEANSDSQTLRVSFVPSTEHKASPSTSKDASVFFTLTPPELTSEFLSLSLSSNLHLHPPSHRQRHAYQPLIGLLHFPPAFPLSLPLVSDLILHPHPHPHYHSQLQSNPSHPHHPTPFIPSASPFILVLLRQPSCLSPSTTSPVSSPPPSSGTADPASRSTEFRFPPAIPTRSFASPLSKTTPRRPSSTLPGPLPAFEPSDSSIPPAAVLEIQASSSMRITARSTDSTAFRGLTILLSTSSAPSTLATTLENVASSSKWTEPLAAASLGEFFFLLPHCDSSQLTCLPS